jgi:hypothetical protein
MENNSYDGIPDNEIIPRSYNWWKKVRRTEDADLTTSITISTILQVL